MKIAHIGKYYYPYMGGIENYLKDIAEKSIEEGIDTKVIVSSENFSYKKGEINGVKIERLRKISNFMNQPLTPGLLFKDFSDYDIVHLHLPNPWASFCLLRKNIKNLVITYHSDIIKYGLKKHITDLYQKTYLEEILEKADKIITTSQNYVDSSDYLKKFKEKIKIIPLGIEIKKFRKTKKIKRDIKKLKDGIKNNKKIILFVGRLIPYKGLEYLIEAISFLERKDLKVLIIGGGPLEEKLKKKTKKLGIEDKIFFLGRVENIIPYYHLCDFLILPSTYRAEAFGIVQLEAMVCGKPVISTNLKSGVPFVNKDKKSGLVVSPKDPEELSEAIKILLDNKKLRKRLEKGARKRVEKLFTKNNMVKKTLRIYKELSKK